MPFGDFPLKSKIVLVTGAGSGINLSFARFCVQEDPRVIVADLKLTEDGERFMAGEGAKAAVFAECDVTKRADLENLLKISELEFGDVPDIYVAGAGVFEPVSISNTLFEFALNGAWTTPGLVQLLGRHRRRRILAS